MSRPSIGGSAEEIMQSSTDKMMAFIAESAAEVKRQCPDVPVIQVPRPGVDRIAALEAKA